MSLEYPMQEAFFAQRKTGIGKHVALLYIMHCVLGT